MTDQPKTSHDIGIEVRGHRNVTITGDAGGDVIVTISLPLPGAV